MTSTHEIAHRANVVSTESWRPGGPLLTPQSSRETVCGWLQWCDANGAHDDANALANGQPPYTLGEAWDAIDAMLVNA